MEMNQKSVCPLGAGTFGTGRIEACFHCHGTIRNGRYTSSDLDTLPAVTLFYMVDD